MSELAQRAAWMGAGMVLGMSVVERWHQALGTLDLLTHLLLQSI